MRIIVHLFLLFILLAGTVAIAQSVKYEGFGAGTKGGTSKKVVHVTNLNSKGPGSLHEAMGSNRTIVFDVSGTISNFRWDSSEEIIVSNLTIDGSTAPAPGITIDNNNNGNALSFQKDCHDIIVKNIRVRNAGNDGLSVVGGYNMVFDHVSVSGSGDGNFDITEGAYNITVQYSIIGGGRPGWSGAMLIAYHPTRNISVHHNLFNSRANEDQVVAGSKYPGERNPLVHSVNNLETTNLMADIRNNIIWNWGNASTSPCCGFGYGTGVDYGGTANIVSNYYNTTGNQEANAVDLNHNSKNARGFVAGNVSGNKGIDPNQRNNRTAAYRAAPVVIQDACTAARKVLEGAGPRPLDPIDAALVQSVVLANCPERNEQPLAYAGEDILLNSPKGITLTGKGKDADGNITNYAWSWVSGPMAFEMRKTGTPVVHIRNLVNGTYVFRLTVTDNKGAVATDDVKLTVRFGRG
ncbi:MAG: hypothetical protein H7Y42_02760 [Chitinophagaceae bacterium]|nr:hypothetical protein [Chitinophagaceae bacterium]